MSEVTTRIRRFEAGVSGLTGGKEFRVEIRVKNNLLFGAIKRAGFDTVAAFSRSCGVNQQTIGLFINLRLAPVGARGWLGQALKIANALRCMPEDLFPADYLRDTMKQNKLVMEYSANEIRCAIGVATPEDLMIEGDVTAGLQAAIGTLTHRQQVIVNRRFGLDGGDGCTTDELGAQFNLTRERVRQIESTALRKLAHKSRRLSPAMLADVGADT